MAFKDAFPPSESDSDRKYQLIVKSHGGSPAEYEELKKVAGGDPRVFFIDQTLSDEENDALKLHADCYVSLHRSEGYGMNILESMGNGIPAIATNYSGNVDFFTAMPKKLIDLCFFPIPFTMVALTESWGPYVKGRQWADPDHNAAVSAMRKVAKNDCKKQFGTEMREAVLNAFGSKVVGEKMKSYLYDSLPAIQKKTKHSATPTRENVAKKLKSIVRINA